MNIGRRLQLVRQSRGLTIDQVAKQTVSSYDRIETGKCALKFDLLLKICEVLEIKIWDLTAPVLELTYSDDIDQSEE